MSQKQRPKHQKQHKKSEFARLEERVEKLESLVMMIAIHLITPESIERFLKQSQGERNEP